MAPRLSKIVSRNSDPSFLQRSITPALHYSITPALPNSCDS
jgi:hypothetical protein